MFLWFLGTSAIAVWFVFRDDKFDYRVLFLGALLPDIVDATTCGAWVLHSVTASVAVLAGVMAVARRGSERRRRWLALPIGMFMHLVFDGAFNNTTVFWWPFSGGSFGGARIASLDRLPLDIALEVAGALMLAWMWRTNDLSDPVERRRFVRTGRLVGGTGTQVGQC